MNGIMGISLAVFSTGAFAVTPEGYWKSIDNRTGEQLSIVEIRKGNDGRYHGKIVYRYPNSHGIALTNYTKCPAPNTNKPILGLEIYLDLGKIQIRQMLILMVGYWNLHLDEFIKVRLW